MLPVRLGTLPGAKVPVHLLPYQEWGRKAPRDEKGKLASACRLPGWTASEVPVRDLGDKIGKMMISRPRSASPELRERLNIIDHYFSLPFFFSPLIWSLT